MNRISIRDKLPSRNSVTKRFPDEQTRAKFRLYSILGAAVATLMTGVTLVIAGLVLIPMMAFAYNIAAVVGASAMIAVGATLALTAYIWLTNPA